MENGRIPKYLLYGELQLGSRPLGRLDLQYKDVCKRDMAAFYVDLKSWKEHALDHSLLRHCVKRRLQAGEEQIQLSALNHATDADQPCSAYRCERCVEIDLPESDCLVIPKTVEHEAIVHLCIQGRCRPKKVNNKMLHVLPGQNYDGSYTVLINKYLPDRIIDA